jgi:glycosyltransferase 2 family protein
MVGGFAVVAYLVQRVGLATILDAITTLSWRLLIIMCFPYALTSTIDTAAWRFAFVGRVPPFPKLWTARLAGEAVNATTPTASVGGEPVKAYLLRYWVSPVEGLASVIVDKTAIVMGQGLFGVLGLLLARTMVPVTGPLLTAMTVLLILQALAVSGFVAVQLMGAAGRGGRLLARFGLRPSRSRQERLEGLDRTLATYYRFRRRRLVGAVMVHFIAWTVGSLEIYLVLRFLGLPVPLLTAMVLESCGAAVKFATFMIPGSLGALEGGNVAIFAASGLGGAVGLSYTLVRRMRELVWASAGMIALAALSGRPDPVEVDEAEGPPPRPAAMC